MKSLGLWVSAAVLSVGMRAEDLPLRCEHPKDTIATVKIAKKGKKTALRLVVAERDGTSREQEVRTIELEDALTVEYRDIITAVTDVGLTGSRRDFGSVRWEFNEYHKPPFFKIPETMTTRDISGVENRVVAFEWDPKDNQYTASFLGKQPGDDPAHLEHLEPSVSALFLSPANAPSEGESWPVSATQLKGLILNPGGGLFTVPVDSLDAQERTRNRTAFWSAFTADITARVVANPEGRRVEYATVELEGTAQVQCQTRRGSGSDTDPLRRMKESMAVTGEAVWNVKQNRLQRLVIDWEGELTSSEIADFTGSTTRRVDSAMVFRDVCHWEMDCTYATVGKDK